MIRGELVPFLARARGAGAPVARFVEREIRAYLECGVLAHGFIRVHCDACGHDRLVAFACPPPRAHQVRYHGVLAPCASGRDRVVPAGPEEGETVPSSSSASESDVGSTGAADGGGDGEMLVARASSDLRAERSDSLARRIAWADLLKRVFEVDALRCPACGGRMRLLAAITDPSVARRILECLALPPRAPPLAPANEIEMEPVVGDSVFELTRAETQSEPSLDFDQTLSEDWAPDDES